MDFLCVFNQDGQIFIFNKPLNKTFHLGDVVTFITLTNEGFIIPSQQNLTLLKESDISIESNNDSYFKFHVSSKKHTCFNRNASVKESILFENTILNKEPIKLDFIKFYENYCRYASYIKGLDINKIFESLMVYLTDSHRYKPGDDDSYTVTESHIINTNDMFIRSLVKAGDSKLFHETSFTPWQTIKEESGYGNESFGIREDKRQNIISHAKQLYSQSKHHCYLLNQLFEEEIQNMRNEMIKQRTFYNYWPTSHFIDLLSEVYDKESMVLFLMKYNNIISHVEQKIYPVYTSQYIDEICMKIEKEKKQREEIIKSKEINFEKENWDWDIILDKFYQNFDTCNTNTNEHPTGLHNETVNDTPKLNTIISQRQRNTQQEVITTGENDFYKELLKSQQWIKIREEVKERDHYVCQNCNNTRRLTSIEELQALKLPIKSEIFNSIVSIYNTKDETIDFDFTFNVNTEIQKESLIPKYNIYKYEMDLDYNAPMDLLRISYKQIPSFTILSSFKGRETPIKQIRFKDYNQTIDNEYYIIRFIEMKGNSTNGEMYLSYLYGGLGFQNHKLTAIITVDEHSIIFPLSGILSNIEQLEVHHTKYAKSHRPWDVSKDKLITLCHSCHIEANKQPIPIE